MADMKAFNERFKVERVNASGDTERVTVQVGLEGLKILNADGTRTTNSYELSHISRWSMRGNSLILYTKTPVDVEERQITFRSNENMIRNVMDTLTCCCMQLCEILQSNGKSSSDKETANSLHQLVKGNGKKVPSLPSVDEVDFWHNAEKQGYLQSQGDHTKFWRRRFFVMKQGYLFRFMNGDLSESTKPRGVVDLSKVTDVTEGRATTGKGNSIKLCTATGSVCYVADSETEMVEWMSALEGAVQRIVKHVAGFADEDSPTHRQPASSAPNDWVKQLESSIGASSSSSAAPSSGRGRYAMVDIVGYDSAPATAPPAHHASSTSYGANNNPYSGSIDYSQIAGIAGIAGDTPSADPTSDLLLNYGAPSTQTPQPYPSAYPASTPSSTIYPTAASQQQYYPSYPTQQQQQQQQPSYQTPSLLDQLPSQAPSYPYYQQPAASSYPSSQQAAALAPQGPPASGSWQVLYTPEGKPYYHNPTTGSTQWEAPPGY